MPKHIALIIGINNYLFFPKLKYAQKDAESLKYFLKEESISNIEYQVDICLCTTTSSNYKGYSTNPTRAELRRILRKCFEETFLKPDDSFWFFFSGHGIRHNNRDYLMPLDGDPEDPGETGIELNYVVERLIRCGADHVVMIFDACRSVGGQKGIQKDFGQDMPKGVTAIFSCNPNELSFEIEDPICQGAFTWVLLNCFRKQTIDKAFTIIETEAYLQNEVPKLNKQYNKPIQNPHIRCDFASNSNKILLPHLQFNDKFKSSTLEVNEAKNDYQIGILDSEVLGENFYKELQDLLVKNNWKAADKKTTICMLKVMNRTNEGWLKVEHIRNFPLADLHNIDKLWLKYSDGRFGFSIQNTIWKSYGSPKSYCKDWKEFGARIGWKRKGIFGLGGKWLSANQLTYKKTAPRGHLPFTCTHIYWQIEELDAESYQMYGTGGYIRTNECNQSFSRAVYEPEIIFSDESDGNYNSFRHAFFLPILLSRI